jgi:hypothetical protein
MSLFACKGLINNKTRRSSGFYKIAIVEVTGITRISMVKGLVRIGTILIFPTALDQIQIIPLIPAHPGKDEHF